MGTTGVTDKDRLLFGAGFVFGVAFTFVVLGTVVAGVGGGQGALGLPVLWLIAASVLLAAIVGAAMFLLAFPENRLEVPASLAPGPDDLDEE